MLLEYVPDRLVVHCEYVTAFYFLCASIFNSAWAVHKSVTIATGVSD